MGIILTLLILGLSNKWIYGKVPVNIKKLPHLLEDVFSSAGFGSKFTTSSSSKVNSLFVRNSDSGPSAMIILVAYDDIVTETVQKIMQTEKIPLIFSVSTLPYKEVELEPTFIQFEQDEKRWHPESEYNNEFFVLFQNSKFGGVITEGEVHQGIVMLPELFDITQPITIKYLSTKRVFSFK